MRRISVFFLLLAVLVIVPVTTSTKEITWSAPSYNGMTMPNAVCRHETIFCAFVAIERYDVRIAYGWPSGVKDLGGAHVQAQAKVNGEWLWLKMRGQECEFGNQDFFDPPLGTGEPFLVTDYFTLDYFVEGMYYWAEEDRLEWEIQKLKEELQQEKGK